MKKLLGLVVAGCAVGSACGGAFGQLLNGNFEQPGSGFRSVASGQTWGNWTCTGPSDIEYVKAEFNAGLPNLALSAYEGQYWIDLCGVGQPSGIAQNISNLSSGSLYNIQFAQAGNVWGGNFNFSMNVLWNNQVVATYSSVHGGNDGANMGWQVRSVDVLAQPGVNRLEFRAVTAINARGPAIDDVQLTLVPTPGAAAMLGLAAAAAGGLGRSRGRRTDR